MKTTIELDDALFRRSKAEAALRGESLKDFFSAALRDYLGAIAGPNSDLPTGWRSVFGVVDVMMVEQVDDVVAREFEQVDPEDWK